MRAGPQRGRGFGSRPHRVVSALPPVQARTTRRDSTIGYERFTADSTVPYAAEVNYAELTSLEIDLMSLFKLSTLNKFNVFINKSMHIRIPYYDAYVTYFTEPRVKYIHVLLVHILPALVK